MSLDENGALESSAAVKGPSALLAEARQRLGLSQKEVAEKLYLTTSFIKHIDDGEFSRIPKEAFIRGYLRTYARVVELSGDEIVALYDSELQVAGPIPELQGVTEEDLGSASITGPVLKTALISLAGMVLIVAVFWSWVTDPEEKTPPGTVQPVASEWSTQDSLGVGFDVSLSPQEATALLSKQGPQEQASLDQAEPQGAMTETFRTFDPQQPALAGIGSENREVSGILVAEESISDQSISDQSISEQSISEQSISEQSISEQSISDQSISYQVISNSAVSERASPGKEPTDLDADADADADAGADAGADPGADAVTFERTTDGTRSFITVNAAGPDKLELSFKGECWVEIADNQFGSVYYDLNQANDVLTIFGTGPFKVLLGKATVVEMIYNGGPVELEPFVGPDSAAKVTVPI